MDWREAAEAALCSGYIIAVAVLLIGGWAAVQHLSR